MNPVWKFWAAFLMIIMAGGSTAFAQTRTHRSVKREHYTNGKLKAVTHTRVTVEAFSDLFNFYRKTRVARTEYDSITGKKTHYIVHTTKRGRVGEPCYEIYSLKIDYDANGKRSYYEQSYCDRRRFEIKNYVEGKVVFIYIEKRRRPQP